MCSTSAYRIPALGELFAAPLSAALPNVRYSGQTFTRNNVLSDSLVSTLYSPVSTLYVLSKHSQQSTTASLAWCVPALLLTRLPLAFELLLPLRYSTLLFTSESSFLHSLSNSSLSLFTFTSPSD